MSANVGTAGAIPAMSGRRQMFIASCIALIATAIIFAVRGDILDDLCVHFHRTKEQMGWVISGAFWGFAISIFIGGQLCDLLGMRKILVLAFLGQVVGTVLTIFASGYVMLAAATLVLGLGNGFVEAAINPLVATIYPDQKTQRLNALHAWWPGGIVIGAVAAYALTKALGPAWHGWESWQIKQAIVLIPVLVYGLMLLRLKLPRTERVQSGVSTGRMYKEALRPLFIVFFLCMWLTASTELGPNQWIASIMKSTATKSGILILAWISLIMLVGRLFAAPVVRKLTPVGLLILSSVLAAVGLMAMGYVHSAPTAYLASFIFALGVCYFWPTMLGVTSERFPAGGALLLGLMGAAGNVSTAAAQPLMGYFYDHFGPAGALKYVAVLPAVLVVVFAVIYLRDLSKGGYKVVKLAEGKAAPET
jgi:MFS family permease